jgi:hypothetical protein
MEVLEWVDCWARLNCFVRSEWLRIIVESLSLQAILSERWEKDGNHRDDRLPANYPFLDLVRVGTGGRLM